MDPRTNIEVKGDKRGGAGEWEELAKRLKRGVQQKAEEGGAKTEMGLNAVMQELSAALEEAETDEGAAVKVLHAAMKECDVEGED